MFRVMELDVNWPIFTTCGLPEVLKSYLHLTHSKRIHTWSSGQPSYGARGAVRGSVPCSRALQSWY